jgi:phospholipase C
MNARMKTMIVLMSVWFVTGCGDNSPGSAGAGGAAGVGGGAGTGGASGSGGSAGTGGMAGGAGGPSGLGKLNHIVVVYLENHSFDNLYGSFPGAEGLTQAGSSAAPQQDLSGMVYATLPQPMDTSMHPPVPDARFPANLPNAPFDIGQYVPANQDIPDLVHRYYQEQQQIHGGAMDRFAAVSDSKGLVMGYYQTSMLPLAQLAQQYTVCDHYFHGAFGGSFLNHMWLIAARAPVFPNAPDAIRATVDPSGNMITDGAVTPDGHVINTSFTVNRPHPASADPTRLVPNQTYLTIGDLLSAHNVTWAWYSGGWRAALAGFPDSRFQFHHQPFAYFASFADGTRAKADHLLDESDLVSAIAAGNLPAVSFWKPLGANNEHPGYTDLITGEMHTLQMVQSIVASPIFRDTAILITYDEHGGFWDHVAPPTRDIWGPGARVPMIIVSPYARPGYVDHNSYDTTSILSLIEHRFGLGNLGGPDANAPDMTSAFDFTRTP